MGGLGFTELIIILVIIMIIFGAGKIPQIGSAFGKTIKNFKKSMKEEDEENVPLEDVAQQAEISDKQDIKAIPDGSESSPAHEPDDSK